MVGDNIAFDIFGVVMWIGIIFAFGFTLCLGLLWVSDSVKKKRDGHIGPDNCDDPP